MNLNNIKIIFFDIDGTLIDMNKKRISDKMLETLIRLQERNIMICLATGRAPMELPRFDGVEADVCVTYNGSYCYTGQKTIYKNPLPAEDVKTIIKNAASIGRPVAAATMKRMGANGKDEDLVQYFAFGGTEVAVVYDFEDMVNDEEIYQIMLGCREKDYPEILKNTRNAKIAAWWDRAVDIIPADSGKRVGVEKVLEYFGLDKTEALAFGDGNNDIDMLQAVGIGVAMENASEQLKMVADDVCGHVAEDGIYRYCVERGLI